MERREKRDEPKKKEKSNYSFLILYRLIDIDIDFGSFMFQLLKKNTKCT
jgi:hypothetical protein